MNVIDIFSNTRNGQDINFEEKDYVLSLLLLAMYR